MSKDKLIQISVATIFVLILGVAGYFGVRAIRNAIGDQGAKLPGRPELSSGSSADGDASEQKTYTHPDYGFTLRYPGNMTLGKFAEGDGEVLLFQDAGQEIPLSGVVPDSSSEALAKEEGRGGSGFQIFISAYNETEPLSKEIILKSDKNFKIENEKVVEIGGDSGAKLQESPELSSEAEPLTGLAFDSDNASLGRTHEVWFVAGENLYQCTSYKEFGGKMEEILGGLRFN